MVGEVSSKVCMWGVFPYLWEHCHEKECTRFQEREWMKAMQELQVSSKRKCVKFRAKEKAKNGEGKNGHEGL